MNKIILCVMHFSISLLSASRMADSQKVRSILDLAGTLPEQLKALLRQEVFPKALLQPLGLVKSKVETLLARYGAKSDLFGWVIPADRADEIFAELEKLREEFITAKAEFLAAYGAACQKHLADLAQKLAGFPHLAEFLDVVRDKQPRVSYLERQIDFLLIRPRMVEVSDLVEVVLVQDDLHQRLSRDLLARAQELQTANRPTTWLGGIGELATKLRGLGYLNAAYFRAADSLDAVTVRFKPGRPNAAFSAAERDLLLAVLGVLADSKRLDQFLTSGQLPVMLGPIQAQPALTAPVVVTPEPTVQLAPEPIPAPAPAVVVAGPVHQDEPAADDEDILDLQDVQVAPAPKPVVWVQAAPAAPTPAPTIITIPEITPEPAASPGLFAW
jgi:hypothetical protein